METHSASAHVLIPERVSIVLGCSRYFRLGLRPHLSVAADCFVRMSGHCYTVDVVDSYWVESATVVLPVPQVLPEETASARLLDFVRRTRPARIFSSASGPHRRHRAARQRSTWNRVQDVTTRLSTHTQQSVDTRTPNTRVRRDLRDTEDSRRNAPICTPRSFVAVLDAGPRT